MWIERGCSNSGEESAAAEGTNLGVTIVPERTPLIPADTIPAPVKKRAEIRMKGESFINVFMSISLDGWIEI
jgi:hypothetical protein